MALTLTQKGVQDFSRTNQYAMMMSMDAALDYVACRCCVLTPFTLVFDWVPRQ